MSHPRRSSNLNALEPLEPRRLLAGDYGGVTTFGDRKTLDSAEAVVIDAAGNTYILGHFQGKIDVHPSPSRTLFLNKQKDRDLFVVKYDPDRKPVWARKFGGAGDDAAVDMALSPDGGLVIAATFDEHTTLTTPGKSIPLDFKGRIDPTVFKLSADGDLLWAGTVGGEKDDGVTSLAVGPDGDVYWAGFVRLEADLDPGKRNARSITRGVDDSFIQRLDGDTGRLKWSRVFGERDTHEEPLALAVNSAGQLFATGRFNESVDFTRSSKSAKSSKDAKRIVRQSTGGYDVYLARLNADTGAFQFVRNFGSKKSDTVADLVVAPDGDILLTGQFDGLADFNPGRARADLFSENNDAFVARYTANGALVWVSRFGGEDGSILAERLATDTAGNIYLTGGFTDEVDFNPRKPLFILDADKDGAGLLPDFRGPTDAFVLRLSGNGLLDFVVHFAGDEGSARGLDIALDPAGNMYIAGAFADLVDFDPGTRTRFRITREDRRDSDAFFLKLLA